MLGTLKSQRISEEKEISDLQDNIADLGGGLVGKGGIGEDVGAAVSEGLWWPVIYAVQIVLRDIENETVEDIYGFWSGYMLSPVNLWFLTEWWTYSPDFRALFEHWNSVIAGTSPWMKRRSTVRVSSKLHLVAAQCGMKSKLESTQTVPTMLTRRRIILKGKVQDHDVKLETWLRPPKPGEHTRMCSGTSDGF